MIGFKKPKLQVVVDRMRAIYDQLDLKSNGLVRDHIGSGLETMFRWGELPVDERKLACSQF